MVIINAVLLHQPRDEVKRALAVLHAIFQHGAAGLVLALVLERAEGMILENLIDDVPDRSVLKYLAVLGA